MDYSMPGIHCSPLLLLLLLSCFSRVRLCATPQTAAHQAPLSMGFARQEYWSGLPLPSPAQHARHPLFSTASPNLLKFMSIVSVLISKSYIVQQLNSRKFLVIELKRSNKFIPSQEGKENSQTEINSRKHISIDGCANSLCATALFSHAVTEMSCLKTARWFY